MKRAESCESCLEQDWSIPWPHYRFRTLLKDSDADSKYKDWALTSWLAVWRCFLSPSGAATFAALLLAFVRKVLRPPEQAMLLASEQVACQVAGGWAGRGKSFPKRPMTWSLKLRKTLCHMIISIKCSSICKYVIITQALKRERAAISFRCHGPRVKVVPIWEAAVLGFRSPLRLPLAWNRSLRTHTKYTNYHRNLFLLCCQSLGDDSWLSTHWRHR